MVEEKNAYREFNFRQMLPWTLIFRGFQVAIDPRKLLLAAAGIMVMSVGWCALTWLFNPAMGTQTFGTWPWKEDRGPNPYLLVTGQTPLPASGHDFSKLTRQEGADLLEPLIKFLKPVIALVHPGTTVMDRIYCFFILLVTLATWALFGGAITRMAAVEVARKEKISMKEAVRFTIKRYLSYFSAPLFPLIFVAIIAVLMILFFGLPQLAPVFGEVWIGILFPLEVLAMLIVAVALVGLIGWPMMSATISAEGTDSWEAVSRSYSYVFQAPWHYLWYGLVALAYGAVVFFFVGFIGSFTVYLTKWSLSHTPGAEALNREPSYLFVCAPTSYHWRDLLLTGGHAKADGSMPLVEKGTINEAAVKEYMTTFKGYNYIGTALVTFWIHLVFLLVIGFGYSYFWTAGTIIYLLMRRKVDDAELDEIYLEEEEQTDLPREAPAPPPPAPAAGASLSMVDAPSLRPTAPPLAPPSAQTGGLPGPSEPPPPTGGDGNPPGS